MKALLLLASITVATFSNTSAATELDQTQHNHAVTTSAPIRANTDKQTNTTAFIAQKRLELMATLNAEITTIFKQSVNSWVAAEDLVKLLK